MNYSKDNRTVMTLDAGGTNLIFSAIKSNCEIVDSIRLKSNADNLDKCIETIKLGFHRIMEKLNENPVAISFAFPGPADYFNGIIGDLPNLPAFRGGVALASILENEFNLPVFINNDGNLYAYGEALGGYLPELNQNLKSAGSPKQYQNLIGITLGTGFGVGLVIDGKLVIGDNSNGGEGWLLRDFLSKNSNVEEHISQAAIIRMYLKEAGEDNNTNLEPKDIYEIGIGIKEGNKEAAINAFSSMGIVLGEAIANILTLIDGIVTIGGGIAGAKDLIFPSMMKQLQSKFTRSNGDSLSRLATQVFNLEDADQLKLFQTGSTKTIQIHGSNKSITYDAMPRNAVAVSKIGTSNAIALGAYAFALDAIDRRKS